MMATANLQLVSATDVVSLWTTVYLAVLAITSSSRAGLVVATFATVNLLLFFYWYSCEPVPPERIQKFLSGQRLVAHRGGADDAPENTLQAIEKAATQGSNAVELDVSLSSDQQAVLMHDDTLERTTDGRGRVDACTLAELQRLNAAANFGSSHGRALVPTLEDAIRLCLKLNMKIYFDVKDYSERMTNVLLEMYDKYPALYESSAVCSFHHQVTYAVKQRDPRILIGHTYRSNFFAFTAAEDGEAKYEEPWKHYGAVLLDWLNVFFIENWLYKFTGGSLILAEKTLISKSYVTAWRTAGVQVVPWTVNGAVEKSYFTSSLQLPVITDSTVDS